jgi:5-formyltetrahydrofolate cyclo-ligase
MLYAPLASELPLPTLASLALAEGKAVLWPRIGAAGELEAAAAQPSELVADSAGAPAPPPSHVAQSLGRGDLLIVPGVAFARDGARLGRGGGHYDRLLARSAGAVSIGAAFDIQVVARLPTEPHDRRVDIVATPSEMWRTAR